MDCPSPQPDLAPVRSRPSRRTLNRRRFRSASTRRRNPLTVSAVTQAIRLSWLKLNRPDEAFLTLTYIQARNWLMARCVQWGRRLLR